MLPKKKIQISLSTSELDRIHQNLLKNDLRTESNAKDLKSSLKSTKRRNQLHHRTTQDTVCCMQTYKNSTEFIKNFQKNDLRAKSNIKNLKSKLKSPKNPITSPKPNDTSCRVQETKEKEKPADKNQQK